MTAGFQPSTVVIFSPLIRPKWESSRVVVEYCSWQSKQIIKKNVSKRLCEGFNYLDFPAGKRRGKFPSTWFTPKNSCFQLPSKMVRIPIFFQVPTSTEKRHDFSHGTFPAASPTPQILRIFGWFSASQGWEYLSSLEGTPKWPMLC